MHPVRRRGNDRGAIAVTTSILLAGGVLLGFMALVVDVGRLYVEREELQSSADAAVLAVAKACSNNTPDCDTTGTIYDLAARYADANSRDNLTGLTSLCGRLPGKLPDCDPAPDNLTRCIGPVPPGSVPYIEIRVHTEIAGGSTVLPPTFGQMMLNNGGFDGTSVGACARATWEPGIGPVGIGISQCAFDTYTANGTVFGPDPPYDDFSNPPYPDEQAIRARGSGVLPPCPSTVVGRDPAPSFSWLPTNGPTDCEVTIPADGIFRRGRTVDESLLGECSRMLRRSRTEQIPIFVIIYDGQYPGTDPTYQGVSVAPFVVTGHRWGADRIRSWNPDPDAHLCGFGNRCIYGFFTGSPIPLSDFDPSRYSLIRLIG